MAKNIKKELSANGLDVGTAFICCARKSGPNVSYESVRNCFFDVEYSSFAEDILKKNNAAYFRKENRLYLLGEDAIRFANFFGKSTRRPLRQGVLSPQEEEAFLVVELLIRELLKKAQTKGEMVYYSVPGSPIDVDLNITYHQDIVKRLLENLGYRAKPLNEGLAVVYSELQSNDFTGLGISIGGGMTNVCLASMAIPILTFSIARAGDWLDGEVSNATNESVSKITSIKEATLNLNSAKCSSDKILQAFYIYYGHLVDYILERLAEEFKKHPGLRFEKSIPIVLTGGATSPEGFLNEFKEGLKKINLPIKIGEVKVSSEPLLSVAKGTLRASLIELEKEEKL